MATYTEPMRPYEFVLADHGNISYESLTLTSGAGSLVVGSVVSRITKRQAAAPIPAVSGSSPGNGTMTGLSFGPDVQVGTYTLACTTAATNGGTFSVTAPDGTALPDATVGTAYKSSHINFLLNDGSSDFTTAARFLVVVTAAGTPVVVGTGDGTIGSITLGKLAQLGTYKVKNVLAGTNTGTWDVIAPDGSTVGHGIISGGAGGTLAFTSDHVNFTITDGTTDFVLGDYFNIIVAGYAAPEGQLWDPTAVNGAQEVYGIITHAADASSTTATVTVLTRLAEVKSAALTWKATVTAAQKTEAYRQMAANLIIARS